MSNDVYIVKDMLEIVCTREIVMTNNVKLNLFKKDTFHLV